MSNMSEHQQSQVQTKNGDQDEERGTRMKDAIILNRIKYEVAMTGLESIYDPRAKVQLYTKLKRMLSD